jgi:hypothetical protein
MVMICAALRGRKDQWMRRVGDGEGAACEALGRWPPEAMPRDVQQPNRHAAVDGGDAGKLRLIDLEPIFPRARTP